MSFCEVPSCNSRYEPGRTYHRFPKDPSKRRKWLEALGRRNLKLKSLSAVCSRHFRSKDYYPGGKRLMVNSIPLLRLKNKEVKAVKTSKQSFHTIQQKKTIVGNKTPQKSSPNKKMSPKPIKMKNNNKPTCSKPVEFPQIKKNENCIPVNKLCKKENLTPRQELATNKPELTKNNVLFKVKHIKQNLANNKTRRKRPSKNWTRYKKGSKKLEEFKSKIKQRTQSEVSRSLYNKYGQTLISNQKSISGLGLSSNTKKVLPTNLEQINSKKSSQYSLLEQKQAMKTTSRSKCVEKINNSNNAIVLKKSLGAELDSQNKKRKIERRDLTCTHENAIRKQIYASQVSDFHIDSNLDTLKNLSKQSVTNMSNIEGTIFEMQNKIKKLEEKSILDEKKIDTFKKALLEQREKDIKTLMDEKENELLLRMDLLYLDYDPQRICRLCLLLVDKNEMLTSLFWPSKNQNVIPLIKSSVGIQVELEDGMPSGICNECLQQIKRVDWIRRRIQRSNMLIKKFLLMKKAANDGSSGTMLTISSEKTHFNDDLFEEEVSDVFKIEDVFSLENSPETVPFEYTALKQEPETNENNRFSEDKELPKINSEGKVKKTHKCRNCNTTFPNCWSLNNHFKYCARRFKCSECNKCFWNSQLFLTHKQKRISCVSAESNRCCYECQVVFRWKWQLVFHVFLHSPRPCGLCDEVLQSLDHLKLHFTKSHISC